MNGIIRKLLIATVSLTPFGFCIPASAQVAEDRTDVVVITASKRDSSVQRIPASVSAVSGDDIRETGLTDLKDISLLVPNLQWSENTGTTMIAIRGVGSTVNSGLTEPTVAIYVDGVYLPRSTMATTRAVDLERIEVLRGPQGTLYGRNATGGAINFISQAPTDTFTGQVSVVAGDRSQVGVEGFVSGPIADGISYRLSGGHEKQDGYVDVIPSGQKLNGTDVNYARGVLRFEPNDDLQIDLALRYEREQAPNAYQQLITPATVPPGTNQTTEPNKLYADFPFSFDNETLVASGTVDWKLSDDVSLKSITSYVDHSNHVQFDADSTDFTFFNVDEPGFPRTSESYGQEFNLVGTTGKLDWILGAFGWHENASLTFNLDIPPFIKIFQTVDTETTNYALFGDLTYSVTDQFRINAGLRYNNEDQTFAQNLTFEFPGGGGQVPGSPAFGAGPIITAVSTDKVLPSLGLQYDLSGDITVYAKWSQGFKSGGQNIEGGAGLAVGAAGLYDPEQIDAYEVGLKSQWFDRTLTANFAAFYYKYDGLQVTNIVPPTNSLVASADARNIGLEAELNWQATDNLVLNGSATFLHARFKDFFAFDDANPGLGIQNLDGRSVPEAPDITLNLGAEYTIPIANGFLSDIVLRANGRYSDDVVLRYYGQPLDTQPAYSLLNISSTLTFADGATSLDAFITNVTDEEYKLHTFFVAPLNAYLGNYGTPRTWGVRLSHRF